MRYMPQLLTTVVFFVIFLFLFLFIDGIKRYDESMSSNEDAEIEARWNTTVQQKSGE